MKYEDEKTTISIPKVLRDKLKEVGLKGETYGDIIERVYEAAIKHQLQMLLLDERNTVTIDEAIRRSKKRWQK